MLSYEQVDGSDEKRPERRTKDRWMGGAITIAVLTNKIPCDVIVETGVEYWDVAPSGCDVVDDAYEQSKKENAYSRSIGIQLFHLGLLTLQRNKFTVTTLSNRHTSSFTWASLPFNEQKAKMVV